MILLILLAVVSGAAGLGLFLYGCCKLAAWFKAEKKEAVVREVLADGSCDEVMQYSYEINVDGKNCVIPGPRYVTYNPLLLIFPKVKVGKTETVRFDKKKMRIEQKPRTSVFYMIIGIFFTVLTIIIMNIPSIY